LLERSISLRAFASSTRGAKCGSVKAIGSARQRSRLVCARSRSRDGGGGAKRHG
jgi:hypothetical protein